MTRRCERVLLLLSRNSVLLSDPKENEYLHVPTKTKNKNNKKTPTDALFFLVCVTVCGWSFCAWVDVFKISFLGSSPSFWPSSLANIRKSLPEVKKRFFLLAFLFFFFHRSNLENQMALVSCALRGDLMLISCAGSHQQQERDTREKLLGQQTFNLSTK